MEKLDDTWLIISIGSREYAVNKAYIQAVTELRHTQFVEVPKGRFIRGVYSIFSSNIVVVDGHKIAREPSQVDKRLSFCKKLSDTAISCKSWIETLEWIVITNNDDKSLVKLSDELSSWLAQQDFSYDVYMNKLFSRIKKHLLIVLNSGLELAKDRINGTIGIVDATSEFNNIKHDMQRYIMDNLDNLSEYYSSKISDMCLVVRVGDKTFGLSIDSVKMVTTTAVGVSRTKRTVLSAGLAVVGGAKYNILDLTKVGSLVI